MHKTEHISIGRQPFVCDTDAYKTIESYLKTAKANLSEDPDADEILNDLEFALADHIKEACGELVVDQKTAQKVVEQMGPVNSSTTDSDSLKDADDSSDQTNSLYERITEISRKLSKEQLYKDHDRAILDGVCAGIAKSFDISPLLVRIAFIVLTFASNGWFAFVYVFFIFYMQSARSNPRKTASQVMQDSKEKTKKTTAAYELVLQRTVRLGIKVLRYASAIISTIALLGVSIMLMVILIFMWSRDNREMLFGHIPTYIPIGLTITLGIIVLLPLFQLVLLFLYPKLYKKPRVAGTLLAVWMLSVVIGVGGSIGIAPKVMRHLTQNPPHSEHVFIESSQDRLRYVCIDLWGGCIKNQPQLQQQTRCNTAITTYNDSDNRQKLVEHEWTPKFAPIAYPASEQLFCQELTKVINEYGADHILISDTPLNENVFQYPAMTDAYYSDGWGTSYYQYPVDDQERNGQSSLLPQPTWFLAYMVR